MVNFDRTFLLNLFIHHKLDNGDFQILCGSRTCLYRSKNKQAEVVNENDENINQMKSMLLARVRKCTPSWGLFEKP